MKPEESAYHFLREHAILYSVEFLCISREMWKKLRELTIKDDFMFGAVMSDPKLQGIVGDDPWYFY